jgi:sugar fermentation stimulation protein A
MKYDVVVQAIFIQRINRFIAEVELEGHVIQVHVKNTGRCAELFIKGVTVYLEPAKNPDRKTKYSLVAIIKNGILINIDSQIPNAVAQEALENNFYFKEMMGEVTYIRREVTYQKSRFDIYYENEHTGAKGFIEVKGVTLEEEGIAMFPDAPTLRGTKHIRELMDSVREGYQSYILFVIQMKGVHVFKPNNRTDPAFSKTLMEAGKNGVKILCFDSIVTPDSILLDQEIPVEFK